MEEEVVMGGAVVGAGEATVVGGRSCERDFGLGPLPGSVGVEVARPRCMLPLLLQLLLLLLLLPTPLPAPGCCFSQSTHSLGFSHCEISVLQL